MVCDALLNYQDDDSVFARYVDIVSSMGKKNEDIDSLVSSHKSMIAKKKKAIAWVQSSNFDIPKHTPQYRMIVQKKILPMAMWDYSQL